MQGRFLLDVVITQGTTIFQLFSSKDETLLVGRNAFLVLDLRLDVVNGVRGLNIKGDGLASQGLDKDLTKEEIEVAREGQRMSVRDPSYRLGERGLRRTRFTGYHTHHRRSIFRRRNVLLLSLLFPSFFRSVRILTCMVLLFFELVQLSGLLIWSLGLAYGGGK